MDENFDKQEETSPKKGLSLFPSKIQNLFEKKEKPIMEIISPSLKTAGFGLTTAGLERKNKSFHQLKQWDEKRSLLLQTHKRILEAIISRLEIKIRFSNQALTGLVNFFKERIIQETEYSKYTQSKLKRSSYNYLTKEEFNEHLEKEKENEKNKSKSIRNSLIQPISRNFPLLLKALHEIDDLELKRAKKIQDFCSYLDITIVKEGLLKTAMNFEKSFNILKENLIQAKGQIIKSTAETAEKSAKYSKLFYEMMNSANNNKKKNFIKDLYNLELDFHKSALEQNNSHRKFGQETIKLWQETLILEGNRLKEIYSAIEYYLLKSIEIFGDNFAYQIPLNLIKGLNSIEDIEKFYSIKEIINLEEGLMIKKFLNLNRENNLTIKNMEEFFGYFKYEINREEPLIMNKCNALRDVGGFIKNFKECEIIFTVDCNLLFIEKGEIKKADIVMAVDNVEVKIKPDKVNLEIVEKVSGIIFDSKKKISLRFNNCDLCQEFVDIVNLNKNR